MVALPFGRLSNRALAASGGKCGCGPPGRGNYKIPDIRIGAGFYPARGWSATPTFLYLVGAGVPDGPLLLSAMLPVRGVPRPRARFFRCTPLLALVGAGVPDGPLLVLSPKGYFALRRDSLLPTAAKGCKNAAKNQWFLAAFFCRTRVQPAIGERKAARCGRRVRAQRPPVRKKRKTAEAVFLFWFRTKF